MLVLQCNLSNEQLHVSGGFPPLEHCAVTCSTEGVER